MSDTEPIAAGGESTAEKDVAMGANDDEVIEDDSSPKFKLKELTLEQQERIVKRFLEKQAKEVDLDDTTYEGKKKKAELFKLFCDSENISKDTFRRMKRKVIHQWWFFCASSDSFLEHFDAKAIAAAKEASSFEDWFREVNVNVDRRSKSELPFVTGPAEKKIKIGDASDHLYMS